MKLYSQKTSVEPKAGENYRAKAKEGYRNIRIIQVRKSKYQPYVLAKEYNYDYHPLFKIALTFREGLWRMPIRYEKFEL